MYPDSPYANPISSFQTPVPAISVEPDAEPTETICVNSTWLQYLRGAAKQLLLESTWKTDDVNTIDIMQQRAFNLIGLLQGGIPGCGLSHDFPDWFFGIGNNAGTDERYNAYTEAGLPCMINNGRLFNGGTLKGMRISDSAWVGGIIDKLFIYTNALVQVSLVDCLNQVHSQNIAGPFQLYQWGFSEFPSIKEIVVASPYLVTALFSLRIISNWQCGPA